MADIQEQVCVSAMRIGIFRMTMFYTCVHFGSILIDLQNQAAFQKQDKFSYRKVHLLGKKANQRWYADIGLGIKTPAAAINGRYIDKKCPFTSDVTIRGAILKGLVISTKMERTIIVRRDYLRYVKKYRRWEI